MSDLPIYSSLFSCLYDEQEPVGHLGRGTHYSVFKCVEWLDVERQRLDDGPQVHDFAVIWDEDHDERVIAAIEAIYMAGLLSPVQFIGERKGMLTVIVAAKFYFNGSESDIEAYRNMVETVINIPTAIQDDWSVEIGSFDRVPESAHQCISSGIINDDNHRILTYLRNIDSLWNLGSRDYFPGM